MMTTTFVSFLDNVRSIQGGLYEGCDPANFLDVFPMTFLGEKRSRNARKGVYVNSKKMCMHLVYVYEVGYETTCVFWMHVVRLQLSVGFS